MRIGWTRTVLFWDRMMSEGWSRRMPGGDKEMITNPNRRKSPSKSIPEVSYLRFGASTMS
jgi:hypothetical protein